MDNKVKVALEGFLEKGKGKHCIKNEEKIKPALEKFQNDYSVDKIKSLTKEEYCIGLGDRSTFCFKVEHDPDISQYGSIRGQACSRLYNLYYNKDAHTYRAKKIHSGEYSEDPKVVDDIFKKTKEAIIKTIESLDDAHNGTMKDFEEASAILNSSFQNKIAFLYDSERQIPIYSYTHLTIILDELGINNTNLKSAFLKREALYDYYINEVKPKYSQVTPYVFMCFIYDEVYGYSSLWNKKGTTQSYKSSISSEDVQEKLDEASQDSYDPLSIFVSVQAETLNTTSKASKTHKSKTPKTPFTYPDEEDLKKLGDLGEQFVYEKLQERMVDLKISDIQKVGGDPKYGYDISFLDKEGNLIKVDVKARRSVPNDKVDFILSSHEYETMMSDPTHYYVFFLNHFNEIDGTSDKIEVVTASDIDNNKKPYQYSISFKKS